MSKLDRALAQLSETPLRWRSAFLVQSGWNHLSSYRVLNAQKISKNIVIQNKCIYFDSIIPGTTHTRWLMVTEGYVLKTLLSSQKKNRVCAWAELSEKLLGPKRFLSSSLQAKYLAFALHSKMQGPCSPNGPMSSSGLGELYPILLALLLKLQDPFLEVKGILAIAETVWKISRWPTGMSILRHGVGVKSGKLKELALEVACGSHSNVADLLPPGDILLQVHSLRFLTRD